MTDAHTIVIPHYTLDRELVATLVSKRNPADQDAHHREIRDLLRSLARRYLDGSPGYFLITGLGQLTEEDARHFVRGASATLGRLLPQDSNGTVVRDVRDQGVTLGEGSTGRYSETRQGGNLHTDSPHRPGAVPDYFALHCVHQAVTGGALVLVHLADVLAHLHDKPDVVRALRVPVHFDRRENTPETERTVARPVIESRDSIDRAHYLREYIEIGHRHPHVPSLPRELTDAFDALDALLENPLLQKRYRLREGETIFVDNRTVFHGRTAFEDGDKPKKRLLLRTWIAAT